MAKKQQIPASDDQVSLIYDGECPVCIAYSDTVETGEDEGRLRRIDARSDDPLVKRATEEGLDLDDGMVVVHRGKLRSLQSMACAIA
jgi:predicted DCC family thiol-disulfide oxidoreductase YuxK